MGVIALTTPVAAGTATTTCQVGDGPMRRDVGITMPHARRQPPYRIRPKNQAASPTIARLGSRAAQIGSR